MNFNFHYHRHVESLWHIMNVRRFVDTYIQLSTCTMLHVYGTLVCALKLNSVIEDILLI